MQRNQTLQHAEAINEIKVKLYLSFSSGLPLADLNIRVMLSEQNKQKVLSTIRDHQMGATSENGFVSINKFVVTRFMTEIRQKLWIELCQKHSEKFHSLSEQASIGEVFSLKRFGTRRKLKNGNAVLGEVMFGCEEITRQTARVRVQFRIENVQSERAFLCLFPERVGFKMFKRANNQVFPLLQSPKTGDNLGHTFDCYQTSLREFCNDNANQSVSIQFVNEKSKTVIGETALTVTELQKGKKIYDIKDDKGQTKGDLQIVQFSQTNQWHSIDFLENGMQYALVIGLDYTSSNGEYNKKSSLHYFDDQRKSCYEKALEETASILLDFDNDKLVPLYGFGAKVRIKKFNSGALVSHHFPLNGDVDNPSVLGMEGILATYRQAMPFLQFSKPSKLGPIMRNSIEQAKQMKAEGRQYMILMLLTDGQIHDGDEVVDMVVECGDLPISIILIGISNDPDESWMFMHTLDDNDCKLINKDGVKTKRDCVTFVEYKKYENDLHKLSEQVLKELPRQVVEYHSLAKIEPSAYNKFLSDDVRGMERHLTQLRYKLQGQGQMMHHTPEFLREAGINLMLEQGEIGSKQNLALEQANKGSRGDVSQKKQYAKTLGSSVLSNVYLPSEVLFQRD